MPDVSEPPSRDQKKASLMTVGRREFGTIRRWMRGQFTHERVVPALKTFGWVAPLTLLIWVYAEREQVTKTENPMPIPIEVTSADPTRIVTLLRPTEPVILADLEGPRSELEALRSELSGARDAQTVEIPVGNRSIGKHEVTTAALLGNNWRLTSRGIRVVNCQPPILVIAVDEYEEEEVPVVVPPSVTNLAAPAVFSPATIRLRAPSEEIDRIRADGPLQAFADIERFPELNTPGNHTLSTVRVFIPGLRGEHVSINPGSVRATLEVRDQDQTARLPYLVVHQVVPPNLLKEYRIEAPEQVFNVEVVGPPDKIELLEKLEYEPKPKALLEISRDDATGQPRRRRLRIIDLPQGVSEVTAQEVDFRLIRITSE